MMLRIGGLFVLTAGLMSANPLLWVSGNSAGGQAVFAQAAFTLSEGQLVIDLQNLLSNPTSVAQNISGLEWQFSPGVAGASGMTGSAWEITIAGNTGTLGSFVDAGWGLGQAGDMFLICVICGGNDNVVGQSMAPAHTIVGPGPYTNANGSLDGNIAHNPFLDRTATFTITNPNITSTSAIGSVTFFFGTTFGASSPGALVPEPATAYLLVAGLACVGGVMKFKTRRPRI